MQRLTTIKDKSQASWSHLVEAAKQQPEERKVWGVTMVAAVAGGVALATVSKGVLAIVGTLAVTPVALSVGALAGGAVGWRFMQNQPAESTLPSPAPTRETPMATTAGIG